MADFGVTLTDLPVFVIRCFLVLFYTVYLCILRIYHTFVPPQGKSIKEQHVLITGAGGALGRELALCFAREGCRVTCVDVNVTECEATAALAKKISGEGKARHYYLDVTDRQAICAFSKQIEVEVGPVDILVNNAGIVQAGNLLNVTDDQITKIIDVNLMSHFWTIRAFLPAMLSRNRGHVVAISSAACLAVASNIAPYTASKAGVSALMGCLREEIRKRNSSVKTTTVQPFFLAPPENKKHWEVKSVLPDITAASVAASTVEAVKQEVVTLTIPTYLYFLMYIVRFVPAVASDMWRDLFQANINALSNSSSAINGKTK